MGVYISEIKDTIKDIMLRDRATVLMGMNVSSGGIWGESADLSGAISKKRLIDTPYSIPTILGSALGLSMSGAKPIVTLKGEYLLKAMDVLANKIAISEHISNGQFPTNILILSEIRFKEFKGAQAVSVYEKMLAGIKGLKVLVIASAKDVRRVLTAAYEYKGAVMVLFCSDNMHEESCVSEEEYIPGKGILVREGEDVTVITYGTAIKKVLAAADMAQDEGVSAEVIDLVDISDIDMELIEKSVEKTAKVIIVHDSSRNSGIGAEVSAKIAESEVFFYLEDKIVRLCGKDEYIPYSKEDFDSFVPDKADILKAILNIGK